MEVRTEESQLEFPIIGFKPYANIFDEPIEYEQLKSSSQFAYLKIEDGKWNWHWYLRILSVFA